MTARSKVICYAPNRRAAPNVCRAVDRYLRGGGIMQSSMKVLLTGGTGFLGEYLLAELLDRGHSVWCLYR